MWATVFGRAGGRRKAITLSTLNTHVPSYRWTDSVRCTFSGSPLSLLVSQSKPHYAVIVYVSLSLLNISFLMVEPDTLHFRIPLKVQFNA